MKRIVEKVKDIVEVCQFTHLNDFAADPGLTLAGYRFTDITAALMAKWLDSIVSVRPGRGTASALAGFRGVGKSHFLASVAVILTHPELRSRITDPHVSSSVERLSRRHNPVAFVRRGSGPTLIEELKRELSKIIGAHPSELSDSLYDVLLQASEKAGDMPLVILFDTAPGRESRVSRDDGVWLSEIAEAAKTLGIFVGAALDDDIAGADGPNAAISGCFSIDFLDQEHLYKIVDSFIFSKHSLMLGLLHDIYEYYREVMPGFRWSEVRFSALYPLHPATVEIAPLIRLYIHDFALLGFAAESGVKILGRPADSLIGLDETFNSVEARLRQVPELIGAFETFDLIEREVLSKTPVQARLQAKLVLKGLMLLSMGGQGSTAAEIAASMLIFSSDGSDNVESLLNAFADAAPAGIVRTESGGSSRYCLKAAGEDKVEAVVASAVAEVSDEDVWNILLQQMAEKFPDVGDIAAGVSPCSIEWRGTTRRGAVIWRPGGSESGDRLFDWRIHAGFEGSLPTVDGDLCQSLRWRVAEPTPEERAVLQKAQVLQSDADVRSQLGEGLATAVHLNSIAVERIWQRIFLTEGQLMAGDRTIRLDSDPGAIHGLSHLFSTCLAELFESEFPSHPVFAEQLGPRQEAGLVAGFLGGAGADNAEAQRLAAVYGMPLGVAVMRGDGYAPAPADELLDLPCVKSFIDFMLGDEAASISDICRAMQSPPFGLSQESQHIILTALVAARHVDFVTSSGNRINHRSLDLQIVWDDIVGLSRPLSERYSSERLLIWAQLITGNSAIMSLDRSEDRLLTIDSLAGWLAGWNDNRVLSDFDELPDESLSASIWRTAANLRKTFGAMADIIGGLVRDDSSLDDCIHAIADLFSDSESEFESKKNDLRVLREYISGVSRREMIASYLAISEMTSEPEIEAAREALLEVVSNRAGISETKKGASPEDLWNTFAGLFSDHYAERHDFVMNEQTSGESLRKILCSEEWSAFECLASIPWFDQRYVLRAKGLIREIRQLYCKSDVRISLETRPYCSCLFSLTHYERLAGLPAAFHKLVGDGIESFKMQIMRGRAGLVAAAGNDAMRTSVAQIVDRIAEGSSFAGLATQDFRILKIVASRAAEFQEGDDILDLTANIDPSEPLSRGSVEWRHDIAEVEAFVNTEL
jgi:hypothetical protein